MARQHLAALSFALLALSAFAKVPSYMKTCGRRDPQLNECVKDSVEKLKPKLQQGLPEYQLQSLDPLDIGEVVLADLKDFKAVASGVKLKGITGFVIKDLNVDLDQQEVSIKTVLPKVYLDSSYDVKARIIVPVNEQGPISMTSDDVGATLLLKFQLVEHKGRTYMYFNSLTFKLHITDYVANFRPGANDNPITEAINSVLTTNRKDILESMVPNLEKAISTKLLEVTNKLCKHFTYDELFPDRT